jgi:hypothetical protein
MKSYILYEFSAMSKHTTVILGTQPTTMQQTDV